MKEGYLTRDCVLGPGREDGQRGQKVSQVELGEETFQELVFNGVVQKDPVPEVDEAPGSQEAVKGRRGKTKSSA